MYFTKKERHLKKSRHKQKRYKDHRARSQLKIRDKYFTKYYDTLTGHNHVLLFNCQTPSVQIKIFFI